MGKSDTEKQNGEVNAVETCVSSEPIEYGHVRPLSLFHLAQVLPKSSSILLTLALAEEYSPSHSHSYNLTSRLLSLTVPTRQDARSFNGRGVLIKARGHDGRLKKRGNGGVLHSHQSRGKRVVNVGT